MQRSYLESTIHGNEDVDLDARSRTETSFIGSYPILGQHDDQVQRMIETKDVRSLGRLERHETRALEKTTGQRYYWA